MTRDMALGIVSILGVNTALHVPSHSPWYRVYICGATLFHKSSYGPLYTVYINGQHRFILLVIVLGTVSI